jgi:aminodeoxyfutalosine synthase
MATLASPARRSDTALEKVREKVLAGRRLDFEDGVALYKTHDLLGLGALANHVREQRHGDAAYFVWNTHINHTNVCVATCDFCAFAAKKDEPRAYTMASTTSSRTCRAARRACARSTSWAACTPTCRSPTSRT